MPLTEANQLILFREIITVWLCESYKTQNAVLLSVEANVSCSGHCVIELYFGVAVYSVGAIPLIHHTES